MRRSLIAGAAGFLALVIFACSGPPEATQKEPTGKSKYAPEESADEESAPTSTTPPAPRCGDGKCDSDESCKTCASDCGACPVCNVAKACSSIGSAPGTLEPKPELNVKMEAMDKEKILTRLIADVESGAPGMHIIDRALKEPVAGELSAITTLREHFATRPAISAALRRQLTQPMLANAIAVNASSFNQVRDATPDAGAGDGGVDPNASCEAPKLVMRVGKITVNEEDDDVANDIVYCNIAVESPGGSELRITPKTKKLDEGDSHTFNGTEATFWGQKEPRAPNGDLTIRYDCYEEDASNGYGDFVKKAGELLQKEGKKIELPGGYGWILTAVNLVTKYLPSLLALDSDDHLFIATQTIPRSEQLTLAAGRTWNVRKKGTHYWSDWDWSLKIDAWGCTDNGVAP